MQPALRPSLYEQLTALPEGLTGELLNGQLHTQPRPAGRHLRAESTLGSRLHRRFDEGDGGPGGWWILVGPEVHFVRDTEVAVPDLAGWRRERMPEIPDGHRFEVVPDWVCEILSPATESRDRDIKPPLYARYGVPFAWLVDPGQRSLEVYGLRDGTWVSVTTAEGDATVAAPPFEAVPLSLAALWG